MDIDAHFTRVKIDVVSNFMFQSLNVLFGGRKLKDSGWPTFIQQTCVKMDS